MNELTRNELMSAFLFMACGINSLHLTKNGIVFRIEGTKNRGIVMITQQEDLLFCIKFQGSRKSITIKDVNKRHLAKKVFGISGKTSNYMYKVGAWLTK